MKIKDLMIRCEDAGYELKTFSGKGPSGATIGLDLCRPSGQWMWFRTVADLKQWLTYQENNKDV